MMRALLCGAQAAHPARGTGCADHLASSVTWEGAGRPAPFLVMHREKLVGLFGLDALAEVLVVLRELRSVVGLLLFAGGIGLYPSSALVLFVVGLLGLRLVGGRHALPERV